MLTREQAQTENYFHFGVCERGKPSVVYIRRGKTSVLPNNALRIPVRSQLANGANIYIRTDYDAHKLHVAHLCPVRGR